MGNNTNIFPSQIQEFPIPDWEKDKQNRIAENIKKQIDEQNKYDEQIYSMKNQINKIIENSLNPSSN